MDFETIAALRQERRGYVARGLTDRVAQVDAALADLGVQEDGIHSPVLITKEPANDGPAKRGPGRPAKRPAGERD